MQTSFMNSLNNMLKRLIFILFICLTYFFSNAQNKINCDLIVEPEDLSITNYSAHPGDTICIMAGYRPHLYFKGIKGDDDNPVVIINYGGQVHINSDKSYGMRFAESRYVKITGSGSRDYFYGIKIDSVSNGSGLEIRGKSSDFEVEQMEIKGTKYVGIVAKTDPDCTFTAVRDSFTMYNVHIHDNYIHHTGNEGMYVGNSFFLGHSLPACDTVVLPHIIDGVRIYNNILEYTGWDGIQVGCALNDCQIYNNTVNHDSQDEATYQMSGIIINTGSRCDVHDNRIIDGKGTGIINQGAGGQHFYNNLIVNAGRDYFFEDQILKQQFGIFSKFKYIEPPDSSFYFYNNTIINPKSDGIRYDNEHSADNIFVNNLIINPGAFMFYDTNGSVNNTGQDAYIHNYLHGSDMYLSHNIFDRNMKLQFFADTLNNDFHLSFNSPAYNSGLDVEYLGLEFDLDSLQRPFGGAYDIGAYELQSGQGLGKINLFKPLEVYPIPATDVVLIKAASVFGNEAKLFVFDSKGNIIDHKDITNENLISYPITNLNRGVYFLEITTKLNAYLGKFVKM